MTKKEIREKLCALCLYAPYGVKVKHDLQEFPCELQSVDLYRSSVECVPIGEKAFLGTQHFHVEFVKPVLRTMESITEEEKEELSFIASDSDFKWWQYWKGGFDGHFGEGDGRVELDDMARVIKWLCEKKFDFMNLIQRGMAVNEQDIF